MRLDTHGPRDLHLLPVFGRNPGEVWFCDESAVQEGHDVERCPDNAIVVAHGYCSRYRYICVIEGVYDSKLAIYSVGCFRQELPRRLLSHDISLAIGSRYLVGGIRLTKAKLPRR